MQALKENAGANKECRTQATTLTLVQQTIIASIDCRLSQAQQDKELFNSALAESGFSLLIRRQLLALLQPLA